MDVLIVEGSLEVESLISTSGSASRGTTMVTIEVFLAICLRLRITEAAWSVARLLGTPRVRRRDASARARRTEEATLRVEEAVGGVFSTLLTMRLLLTRRTILGVGSCWRERDVELV